MKRAIVLLACSLIIGVAERAWAQDEGTRPAATTSWGDTGLWFVPTGDVLPARRASVSVQRTEEDFTQGKTNVSSFPITGAFGFGRVEVFGALRVVTRIDRDTTPLLFSGPGDESGGLVNEYPTVNESWSGNRLGDLLAGVKFNITSQQRREALALAVRATAKFPTADADVGAGSGKMDGFVDIVASREMAGMEVAGFGGLAMRGDPGDVNLSDGFRWGAGAGFPARGSLRATAEIFGEYLFAADVTAPAGTIVGADGSLSPATSRLRDHVTAAGGITWQHRSGMLLGAAMTYRMGLESDDPASQPLSGSDAIGLEFRIGFHRGVKTYVPPPPAVAAAPPLAIPEAPAPAPQEPAPAANRAPTVRAICDPCTLAPDGIATLRAEAMDPDGDPVTFLWSTTGGTITDTRAAITQWHAETAPGLITFTVVAEDARGASAKDTVTIEVAGGEEGFEDVLFEFDSSALDPEAAALLEPVIAALAAQPDLHILVEGHTCNVGTAEYNLALGERRAAAVRDHLVARGIAADRISTMSFGEERPAHDNDSLETRRLNRRAVPVLRATD